jgi:hypothetical protein
VRWKSSWITWSRKVLSASATGVSRSGKMNWWDFRLRIECFTRRAACRNGDLTRNITPQHQSPTQHGYGLPKRIRLIQPKRQLPLHHGRPDPTTCEFHRTASIPELHPGSQIGPPSLTCGGYGKSSPQIQTVKQPRRRAPIENRHQSAQKKPTRSGPTREPARMAGDKSGVKRGSPSNGHSESRYRKYSQNAHYIS